MYTVIVKPSGDLRRACGYETILTYISGESNNPVINTDSSGELFFTAMGAVCGFIGSAVPSLLNGEGISKAIDKGVAGAVGGAIAGAGIDLALLTIGTLGATTAPLLGAFALAYGMGGIGNVIGSVLSSEELYNESSGAAIDPTVYLYNVVVGGTLNCLSLGTSLTCVAKTFTAIDYLGLSGFGENLAMGATISIAGGIVGKNPFTHSNQKVQENFVEVEVFP